MPRVVFGRIVQCRPEVEHDGGRVAGVKSEHGPPHPIRLDINGGRNLLDVDPVNAAPELVETIDIGRAGLGPPAPTG